MTMRQWRVYRQDVLDYGDGHIDRKEHFVGSTYAPSEEKAVNNVKYRLGIKPQDDEQYYSGDGCRRTYWSAR